MQIDSLTLDSPFILAPLAGYTDLAFRLLCREYGAGLCYSEMISSHGLVFRQQNTIDLLQTVAEERPVNMQLFGAEPEIMGEAAAIVCELVAVDCIDINMGCPVKKVIKKGAGCALMREPKHASRIIRQVADNAKVPVTVKFRSGWNHHTITAVDFARMAEDSGARAVTVHARTWTDGFSGEVDWDVIRAVKKAVTIPVIGNGDILAHEEGIKMMRQTGCDGVMIGRAALGNPQIFTKGEMMPSRRSRLTALKRHLELIARFFPLDRVLAKTKNHAGKYLRGLHGGAAIRARLYDCKDFDELTRTVEEYLNRDLA
ncbi:MAG: tRNA dihydrouridine synthase DusB [Desulfobulbaceae bacterium]|nr:tRNA dihydrouridine synthase DusB [Desulfobulbaceae bacterium]